MMKYQPNGSLVSEVQRVQEPLGRAVQPCTCEKEIFENIISLFPIFENIVILPFSRAKEWFLLLPPPRTSQPPSLRAQPPLVFLISGYSLDRSSEAVKLQLENPDILQLPMTFQ